MRNSNQTLIASIILALTSLTANVAHASSAEAEPDYNCCSGETEPPMTLALQGTSGETEPPALVLALQGTSGETEPPHNCCSGETEPPQAII